MTEKAKTDKKSQYEIIKLLTSIFKELGLPGFITVIGTSIFFIWGTTKQKEEFVDSFILLKNVNQNPFPFVIIVVFLLLVIILGGTYYNRMLTQRKNENRRLGREKSELHKILLRRELNTSNKEEQVDKK